MANRHFTAYSIHHTAFHHESEHLESVLTPLYPGYGTHFAYIYVGLPNQRQSVILDTGSHYTAFPCKSCVTCGSHTDNYFDVEASSSAYELKCGSGRCIISQSYAEGSSWRGYKVSDLTYVGGDEQGAVVDAGQYQTRFIFACITSETGTEPVKVHYHSLTL